jgi:hypothetical protein
MVNKCLVRTPESHADEKQNVVLCQEIMGFKYEHEITRHHLMRQVRLQYETINDLVVELYATNPAHILFKDCPDSVKYAMAKEIGKRENNNNYGFGSLPRNRLHF